MDIHGWTFSVNSRPSHVLEWPTDSVSTRPSDKTINKLTLPDGCGVLVKNKHQLSNGIHITEKIQIF